MTENPKITRVFTATQAAQKNQASERWNNASFTATQAAQKDGIGSGEVSVIFTATQAAQKSQQPC